MPDQTVVYHPTEAPDGLWLDSKDAPDQLKTKGWVDTPAKFPKSKAVATSDDS